jgi:2-polyprenyl-6-methoxyphenol hydroxylase-like FAD-dependent oxidoreductase
MRSSAAQEELDLGRTRTEEVVARFDAPPVVVHRGLLQTILLAALDQGVLRLRRSVWGRPGCRWVTVRLADGSTEQGDLVVGADGLHSQVRAVLVGMGHPGTPATPRGVASCRLTGRWPIVSAPAKHGVVAACSASPGLGCGLHMWAA